MEGRKARLSGDGGEARDSRAKELEVEVKRLKDLVADLAIENHQQKERRLIAGHCSQGHYTKVPPDDKLIFFDSSRRVLGR